MDVHTELLSFQLQIYLYCNFLTFCWWCPFCLKTWKIGQTQLRHKNLFPVYASFFCLFCKCQCLCKYVTLDDMIMILIVTIYCRQLDDRQRHFFGWEIGNTITHTACPKLNYDIRGQQAISNFQSTGQDRNPTKGNNFTPSMMRVNKLHCLDILFSKKIEQLNCQVSFIG